MRAGLLPLLALALGCNRLTAPPEESSSPPPGAATLAPPAPPPVASAPPPSAPVKVRVLHVLTTYKGARRADPSITRSKEDARKQAQAILRRTQSGADLSALAREFSDDKASGARGGHLGEISAEQMPSAFFEAAAALKPGEISGVVETPLGFHVLRRLP